MEVKTLLKPLQNAIQIVFDTTELYADVPEDTLHRARRQYATAIMMFYETDNYESVIDLLDRVMR